MKGLADGVVLVLDAGDVLALGRALDRRWTVSALRDVTGDEARRARALLHAGRHRIDALERRLAGIEAALASRPIGRPGGPLCPDVAPSTSPSLASPPSPASASAVSSTRPTAEELLES